MAGIDWNGIGKSEDNSFPAGELKVEQDSSLFENVRVMDRFGKQSVGSEYPNYSAPVYSSQTPSQRITQKKRDGSSQQTQYTSGQSYFDTMPTFDPPPGGSSFPGFMDVPEFGGQGNRQSTRTDTQNVNQHTNHQRPSQSSNAGQRSKSVTQPQSRKAGTQKSRKPAKSPESAKSTKVRKKAKGSKTTQSSKSSRSRKVSTSQNVGEIKKSRKKTDRWEATVKRENENYSKNKVHKNTDKIKAERKKTLSIKRRLVIILAIMVVIVAIGAVAAYFIGTNYLVVSKINVTNVESPTYSDEEIIEATDISIGDSMLFINVSSVEDKVTTKLPYIGKATVKKDWPNTFSITVEETTDKFAVMLDNDYVWLSGDGKVLSTTKKSISSGKVKVIGFYPQQEYEVGEDFSPSDENKEYYDVLKKISAGIDASGLKIKSVEFLDGELVCLTYNKYIKIYGKYDNDYASKLAGVKEILQSKEKITVDYYFDIRTKGEIIENYGTFS